MGAEWLANRRHALLADVMGLGKSGQAITAAVALQAERVLIVAPLATALGWQREARLWGGPEVTVLRRKDATPTGAGWFFVPWTDLAHRLPSLLAGEPWQIVIADEVHRAKAGSRTATGEAMWGSWSRDRKNGNWQRKEGLVDRVERLWCLTGTPMPNGRPIEAYPLLHALGCSVAKSRSRFVEHFCYRSNSFAPRGFDEMGAMNLDELNERMAEVMLRRTPETVPGELPNLLRVTVPLDGEDVEHEGLEVEVDEYGNARFTRDGLPAFDEMARYRAELGQMKVAAVADWVRDYVSDGNGGSRPLVVFTHHRDVAHGIAAALPEGWAIVATGDDDAVVRQAKVDQFAAPDGPLVFVGTAPACGTGMNGLHRRTTVCAFAEGEWSPADLDQAEGRIRRLGGIAGDAVAHYLLVADSLEEHIMETILGKRNRIAVAVDGEATAAGITAPQAEPAPSPAPVVEETLPAADSLEWGFGKSRDGEWCARVAHCGTSADEAHPWTGAAVTLKSRAGNEKPVVLGERIAGGDGWSLWSFTEVAGEQQQQPKATAAPPQARGDRMRQSWFQERGQRRGIVGASDNTPVTEQDAPAVAACITAARRLCDLDPDFAEEQNGVGWRAGDHRMGEMLVNLSPEGWTVGTLRTARALLHTYCRTQIRDLWPEICGDE
jgi:hypothetical protein